MVGYLEEQATGWGGAVEELPRLGKEGVASFLYLHRLEARNLCLCSSPLTLLLLFIFLVYLTLFC